MPATAEARRAPGTPGAWPAVAVLMPVRDEAWALPAALRSVAAQDYAGPLEVVVADASTDAATTAAARAALPGVDVVPNPGRSAAAGMNAALAATAAPVVVRCDARCALPPDYVRRAVETLARTGAANVGGRLRAAGRTAFERAVAAAMDSPLGNGGARHRVGGPPGPVDTVPLGAFRRDALLAAGGFDAGLQRNEDYETNWRIRQRGGTVWFDPGLSVLYRPRPHTRALARQYFDYGRWKRVVVRGAPRSLRPRQLAPPALVAGLAASAALGVAGAAGLGTGLAGTGLAGVVLPAAWLAALAAEAARTALRRRSAAALAMAWPLAVMHLAWGAGFLAPVRSPRTPARSRRRPRAGKGGGARGLRRDGARREPA